MTDSKREELDLDALEAVAYVDANGPLWGDWSVMAVPVNQEGQR